MKSVVLNILPRGSSNSRTGRLFLPTMILVLTVSGIYLWNLMDLAFSYLNFSEDSTGYISPALSWFNDGVFTFTGRGFVYPALLIPFISGGSLNHVPVIQTLVFLGTVGIFFIVVARSLGRFAYKGKTLLRIMSLLIPLWYFPQIFFALWVLPETIYQLFQILTLFFLVLAAHR